MSKFIAILFLNLALILSAAGAYASGVPNIKGYVVNTDSGFKYVNLHKLEQKHSLILVNFFATWCPPCRAEIPLIERYYTKYKKKGFLIIGVAMNATPIGVKSFLNSRGVTYPVTHPTYNEVYNYGGVSNIPQSFFIYKGNVVLKWQGELSRFLLDRVFYKIYK